MKMQAKTMRLIAILATVATVCNLLTSMIMVAGDYSKGLVAFQLFATLLLTIAAIGNWYLYSKQYVESEVERRLKEQKN